MKYFTKEWCFGDLSDQIMEQKLVDYKSYINNIFNNLPFVLKLLAKSLNLHDGIINNIKFSNNTLILKGVFGDLQSGYFFLKINYSGVSSLNKNLLISIFKDKKIEIISDELEMLSKNLYSHKLFFSTKQEIDITFQDIVIEVQNSTSANYKKKICELEIT